MVLSGRVFSLLKSANNSTLATHTLQERLEQIRAAGWTAVTSEEVPPSDDDDTIEDMSDSTGDESLEVLTDATLFPDDLSDASTSDPGLIKVLEIAATSAAGLDSETELVTVAKYPEGSTPIRLRREIDGKVTVLSHNADLVYEDMVRVTVQITWRNAGDGRTRSMSGQTIITKSTQ
jgi:hypothetical protein